MEHRRESDWIKRILLYGSLVTAVTAIFLFLAYGARAFVRVEDAIGTVPEHTKRIVKLEQWKEIEQERAENTQYWLSQIGKKLGVPAPPPAGLRHRSDRGEREE